MTPEVSAGDVASARGLIEAADLADTESIYALEAIRFTAAGEQASRDVLSSGASGAALWAATWIYVSSADDPSPLMPLLEAPDAAVRVLAAAGAFAMGERSALDVLHASLSVTDQLTGSEPPVTIDAFAVATLSRYIVAADIPPPPTGPAGLTSLDSAWSAWLDSHSAQLAFDSSTGRWHLP